MSYSHLHPVVQVQHLEVALQQVTLAAVAKGAGGRLQQDLLNNRAFRKWQSALGVSSVCTHPQQMSLLKSPPAGIDLDSLF